MNFGSADAELVREFEGAHARVEVHELQKNDDVLRLQHSHILFANRESCNYMIILQKFINNDCARRETPAGGSSRSRRRSGVMSGRAGWRGNGSSSSATVRRAWRQRNDFGTPIRAPASGCSPMTRVPATTAPRSRTTCSASSARTSSGR